MSLEMRYLTRSVEHKLSEKRKALREGLGFEKVLRATNSPMNAVVEQARQFASFDVALLITGEAGTGKAEIARAVHYGSLRSDRAFHEVNCVGVDDRILEIELFGHKRGAIPNLQTNGVGMLQKADRGTIFLNGVETLSPRLQLELVRVATEGMFRPVGGHEWVRTTARIIAGSEIDLRLAVDEGSFRADLYYALAQTTLQLPPLRDRLQDLPVLAQEFLYDAAAKHGKIVHGLSDDALQFLARYNWPGNLRELQNEVLRMLIFSQDPVLGPELISRHVLQAAPCETGKARDVTVDAVLESTGTLKERVEEIEMRILRETLTRLKWNKSRAANELGLSRVGLRAKIERYGIDEPRKSAQVEED
jgi:two-component system response regulator HupR/HoxA